MGISSNTIISIVELVVYIPAIVLSFLACKKHGFSRSSGWYFTLTLSLFRIVGSSCQLATLANNSTGLIIAATILDHIGLTPLLMATLGMMSRQADFVNMSTGSVKVSIRLFRLVQLVMLVASICVIIGIESTSQDSSSSVSPWTYAGAVAYIAAYVAIVFIYTKMLPYSDALPQDEKILIPAIGVALPFVLVRLAYSVLTIFIHSGVFLRTNSGSTLVHVCMAVIEEFVVVVIYLGLAFRLHPLDQLEQGPIQQRPWKARQGRRARRRRGGYEYDNAHNLGPQQY